MIGEHSLVAARALVPQGMQVPPGSMVMGVPGRVVRQLTTEEGIQLKKWADKYVQIAAWCLRHGSGATPAPHPDTLASINCQTQVAPTPPA